MIETKLAIFTTGGSLDAQVDPRFGRCAYFVIVDSETFAFEAIPNTASTAMGGAGIQAAQTVAEKGVKVVITGSVGPNAFQALRCMDRNCYWRHRNRERSRLKIQRRRIAGDKCYFSSWAFRYGYARALQMKKNIIALSESDEGFLRISMVTSSKAEMCPHRQSMKLRSHLGLHTELREAVLRLSERARFETAEEAALGKESPFYGFVM